MNLNSDTKIKQLTKPKNESQNRGLMMTMVANSMSFVIKYITKNNCYSFFVMTVNKK